MRTRTILAGLTFLLCECATGSAAATPITLDFEGLPAMTFVSRNPVPSGAQLSDLFLPTFGVEFSSGSPWVAVVDLGAGHATSGVNGIGGSTPNGILTYDRAFPLVATFFDPTDTSVPAVTDLVSLRGDRAGGGQPITLNAFDVSGQLIASVTVLDIGGATLTIAVSGIHSVQFLGTQDDGGVALDDFTFNRPTAVPEPLVPMLFSAGTVAALGFRWHRRRVQG